MKLRDLLKVVSSISSFSLVVLAKGKPRTDENLIEFLACHWTAHLFTVDKRFEKYQDCDIVNINMDYKGDCSVTIESDVLAI